MHTRTMCTPLKLDNATSSFSKSDPIWLCMRVLLAVCVCVWCPFMYLTTSKPVKYVKRKIVAEYKKALTYPPTYVHTEEERGRRDREKEKLEWMSALVCK